LPHSHGIVVDSLSKQKETANVDYINKLLFYKLKTTTKETLIRFKKQIANWKCVFSNFPYSQNQPQHSLSNLNVSQVCFCKILSVPFSTHIIFLRRKHGKYTATVSWGNIFNEKRFSTCIHNPLPFLCH